MAKKTKKTNKGRPPLPKKERLSESVYVLLNPQERAELDKHARKVDPKTKEPVWGSRSKILREAFREWLKRQKKK